MSMDAHGHNAKLHAVFGGTFDPIHFGHLRVALEAAEQLDALVHLMPANVPPHRPQPVASAAQRLQMVQLAIENVPQLIADDRELRRDKPSYTVDTLLELRAELGPDMPLALIVGWDAFAGLSTWHRWHELFTLAHVCVLTRPGTTRELEAEVAMELYARKTDQLTDLHNAPHGRIYPMQVTALDISATKIRHAMSTGQSPQYLLPLNVFEFIVRHGLYRLEP